MLRTIPTQILTVCRQFPNAHTPCISTPLLHRPGVAAQPKRFARLDPSIQESYRKGSKKYDAIEKARTKPMSMERLRNVGMEGLKREFRGVWNEVKDLCNADGPLYEQKHGDWMYAYKMDSRQEVSKWTVSSDGAWDDGYSHCELGVVAAGDGGMKGEGGCHAVFTGNISTRSPDDGVTQRAGWASISSPQKILFGRVGSYDWTPFNHLLLRVRGDGRVYDINVSMKNRRMEDILRYDIWTYKLYTRGGPYWQTAKIPFSNFYLTHKGRIQDNQVPMEKDKVRRVGIALKDNIDGRFKLEIDYLALMYDMCEITDFKWEMYTTDNPLI